MPRDIYVVLFSDIIFSHNDGLSITVRDAILNLFKSRSFAK